MNIGFKGFAENTVTFQASEDVKAGMAVTLDTEGVAVPCADGDKICGVAINVREGYAAVQLKGYTELPSDGRIPCGWQTVAADAQGRVAVNDAGTEVLVVSSQDGIAGFIL